MAQGLTYPTEAPTFLDLPGGYVAPGPRQRWRQRVISTAWRELVAPDGSVHRVRVPLLRLEPAADAAPEPARRQPHGPHPKRAPR